MFRNAKLFSEVNTATKGACHKLLDCVLPKMSFQEEDIILDIGCGAGDNTREMIKARIPKLKKVVALDVLPEMIEFAREHFPDGTIEYHLANIEDRSSLKPWEGSISKAFSVHCFYLLKDQRKAFQNLYYLLKRNGEAALVFVLSLKFYDCYPQLINSEKWSKYLKDADGRVPDSHRLQLGADHYKKMLEDLGFEVLLCKEEEEFLLYRDEERFKRMMESFTALPYYIPEEMRGEFMDEYVNCILKMEGRNSDGQFRLYNRFLTVHIRKH